jgi:hypothetical protein
VRSTDPTAGAASYTVSATLDPAGFGVFADTHKACPTVSTSLVPDGSPGPTVALGPSQLATVDADVGGTTAITGFDCPAANLCLGIDAVAGSCARLTDRPARARGIAACRRPRPPGAESCVRRRRVVGRRDAGADCFCIVADSALSAAVPLRSSSSGVNGTARLPHRPRVAAVGAARESGVRRSGRVRRRYLS